MFTNLRLFVLVSLFVLSLYGAAYAEIRLAVLGDSLTAGYGLSPEESFPSQLEEALESRGYDVVVINAGVSGDTTAGGLSRLGWTLSDAPDAVIVELGGNDALRGIDPGLSRSNLTAILERLTDERIPTLLAGMQAPRNLGREYHEQFDSIFPELAKSYPVVFYPFFLEGVAGNPDLNQPDGIHPNSRGVSVIVQGILPRVEDLLANLPPGSKHTDQ